MRILVIGASQSGKTVLSKALAKELNCTAADCSDVLIEALAEINYNASKIPSCAAGLGHYIQEIHDNKAEWRPNLIALGNIICRANPAFLYTEAVKSGASIIAGVRRKSEFEAIMSADWSAGMGWGAQDELRSNRPDFIISLRGGEPDPVYELGGEWIELTETPLLCLKAYDGSETWLADTVSVVLWRIAEWAKSKEV